MNEIQDEKIVQLVQEAFGPHKIPVIDIAIRQFPGERIVLVSVPEADFEQAVKIANALDEKIEGGFITVRKVAPQKRVEGTGSVRTIFDPRVTVLIELLNERSRTSEQQPSLNYVKDVAAAVNVAVGRRHNLIFGRRGVGKTALMLEAKGHVDRAGAQTFWINLQTMRSLNAYAAFLTTVDRLCDLPAVAYAQRRTAPLSLEKSRRLQAQIHGLMSHGNPDENKVNLLVPEIQQTLHLFCGELHTDVYLFLDDIHYLGMGELPRFLDLIHSITRDNPVWIKAAGIKHQSRWWSDNPPLGLQTGHDAALINLDVTLEEPEKAKKFLSDILRTYTDAARIGNISGFISGGAADRLVLASGGVPRDFMILCATAIQIARQRANAKATGVQDVNEAAGRTNQIKIQELEDDAASSIGSAKKRLDLLNRLKTFLLDDRQATFFRIDFRDKDGHPDEYGLMQSLMDLRLIHLINGSLSDEHHAGRRSEVYMLDLSQFSGSRFKHNLRVLDFERNHLVLKETGSDKPPRVGDSPRRLLGILRRGPIFSLANANSVAVTSPEAAG